MKRQFISTQENEEGPEVSKKDTVFSFFSFNIVSLKVYLAWVEGLAVPFVWA